MNAWNSYVNKYKKMNFSNLYIWLWSDIKEPVPLLFDHLLVLLDVICGGGECGLVLPSSGGGFLDKAVKK